MADYEELSIRFGTPAYYEDFFHDLDLTSISEEFTRFNKDKGKSTDNYEFSRQDFIKILGRHKLVWYDMASELDEDVEVTRIYHRDEYEYIAFMRIHPNGYRSERIVPAGSEIVFHVLMGKAIFCHKKRFKQLARGNHVVVRQGSTYSIRGTSEDQPTYLIFRVIDKRKK